MVNGEAIAYNIASFLCALFVLERGADVFIDNTVVIAHRTNIPRPVIALLTAGAEWEELVVVVISLARNRSSLAIGNIIGSTISNILGAFSLGLIFYRNTTDDQVLFERSSVIYTALLLLVTSLASALLAFGHIGSAIWTVTGACFIALFAVYIASISYLIARGVTKAPEELSDDGSESDDTGDDHTDVNVEDGDRGEGDALLPQHVQSYSSMAQHPVGARALDEDTAAAPSTGRRGGPPSRGRRVTDESDDLSGPSPSSGPEVSAETTTEGLEDTEAAPAAGQSRSLGVFQARRASMETTSSTKTPRSIKRRSLVHHTLLLGAGFVAIVLSGYVLSNASSNLVDELGISDVLAGVVILSIATTIPEKFVAVLSGYKGQMDIMLANTVGSNIFLLTLCLGITWATTGGLYEGGEIAPAEIAVMFGSTVALGVTVLLQGRFARLIGVALVLGYVAFIGLEFTVIHKV